MVRMVGAMPAVAVRQQRKHIRHEEHKQRPSTLTIDQAQQQPGAPTPIRSPRASPHQSPAQSQHPSPVTSPKSPVTPHKSPKGPPTVPRTQKQPQTCVNGYLFGRISLLHISVICVFLGITLLVVGLVQLAPGTHTGMNKYAIIGSGTGFLALGFTILIILCACQKRTRKRRRHPQAQLLQKQSALAKSRSVSSKGNNKGSMRTPTRHMQVQTVDGALAAANASKSGRSKAGVHPSQQPPVADFKVLNEKDLNVEAFVKSPSESDALLQQTHRRQ